MGREGRSGDRSPWPEARSLGTPVSGGRRVSPAAGRSRPAATALVSSRKVRRPPRLARDGQALAALRSPRGEHLAAAFGLHSRPEAVGLLAVAVARAKRALHARNLGVTTG